MEPWITELAETAAVAQEVIQRLENGDALAMVLPIARRLAEIQVDLEAASWLLLESVGANKQTREFHRQTSGGNLEIEFAALRRFFRVRAVAGFEDDRRERELVQTLSIGELEEMPSGPLNVADYSDATEWARHTHVRTEQRRVLRLVRDEVHRYATASLLRARSRRAVMQLLGTEAIAVLEAGGRILNELRGAIDDLQRPGRTASAAINARTALLTMGRELYDGTEVHKSPINGVEFRVNGEKNQLLAHLDNLWIRAAADRKPLLEEAKAAVEEAYTLGSKAKNPLALSHEEATHAVRLVYGVARAIWLAGGFPLYRAEEARTHAVSP